MMKRIFGALTALVLLAAPARAVDIYISQSGSGNFSGDASNPRSMAWLNSNASSHADTTYILKAGTFTTAPNPPSGTSYANMVKIAGEDSSTVTINASISLTGKYFINLSKFTVAGSVSLTNSRWNRIHRFAVSGTSHSVGFSKRAKYNLLSYFSISNSGGTPFYAIGDSGIAADTARAYTTNAIADTVIGANISNLACSESEMLFKFDGADSLYIRALVCSLQTSNSDDAGRVSWTYSTKNSKFRDIDIGVRVRDKPGVSTQGSGTLKFARDYTYLNSWDSVSVRYKADANVDADPYVLFVDSGSYPGSSGYNSYRHFHLYADSSCWDASNDFRWGWDDPADGDTIEHSVFVTRGVYGEWVRGAGPVKFHHNTLVSYGSDGAQYPNQATSMPWAIGYFGSYSSNATRWNMKYNIFAGMREASSGSPNYYASLIGNDTHLSGTNWQTIDSLNYNLYWLPAAATSKGDATKHITLYANPGTSYYTVSGWNSASGSRNFDANSRIGSPQFTDSTWSYRFNGQIPNGGFADFGGGIYAGAYPPVETPAVTITSPHSSTSGKLYANVYHDTANTITWDTPSYTPTGIRLYYTQRKYFYGPLRLLATGETDDGSYKWNIPDSLAGDSIKIRVVAYTATDSAVALTVAHKVCFNGIGSITPGSSTYDTTNYTMADAGMDLYNGAQGWGPDSCQFYGEWLGGSNEFAIDDGDVRPWWAVFCRFENIDIDYPSAVTSAKLRLYTANASPDSHTVGIKVMDSNSESIIGCAEFVNLQTLKSDIVYHSFTAAADSEWVDVTPLVDALIDDPYTFDGDDGITFAFGGKQWFSTVPNTVSYQYLFSSQKDDQTTRGARLQIIEQSGSTPADTAFSDSCPSLPTQADPDPPTVSLTVPNGGESWNEGQGRTITWTASDDVGVTAIGLWYSTNGGTNWTSIAQGETNDGAYLWTVPNVERESNAMRIRVWATDAAGNDASDSSSTSFTVSDTLRPNKVRNLWATGVHWTAVNLRWTGVANCTTTVLKVDTLPLTESGANNFRAHGTSVSTGTPSAAGVLDSATVTGLTPGTRYYFALRHVDNDGVLAETSLVSIGEVRTTRPAVGKGLRATTTRSYPMLGVGLDSYWEEDVTVTWPRSEAGWPLYADSADAIDTDVMRDSMKNALYGYTTVRNLVYYGTMREAKIGNTFKPAGWGIPDSVFKTVNPSGTVIAAPRSFMTSTYKQHSAGTDTSGWAQDDPWWWGEMNNWARRSTDTTSSRRWGTHVYPERLYLWSATQNSGFTAMADDSCYWGAWYGNKSSPCYGQTTNTVYRYNILSRDTTTGDWDVADHLTDVYTDRLLNRTDYIATPSQHQVDGFWNDYGQLGVDSRFIATKDSVDINRSGLAGIVANYAYDFRQRWAQAGIEMYAQYAGKAQAAREGEEVYHSANLGNADIPILSDWKITDVPELDYTGSKGTGGRSGILANIYGTRFSQSPTIEPSFGVTAYTRRNDHTGLTMFGWSISDSCNPTAFAKDRGMAARGRLGMGYSAMFDDLVPVFNRSSETSASMADPGWPDSCAQNLDIYMAPFYWDESFVNIATGEAVRLGAYGTGTGRGWLGAPVDDRFKWATTVAGASDTNLLSPIQHTDGTFSTLQGWRFSPSLGTASALGRIDTLIVPSGNLGTTDTIIRVSRRGIDHTNFYDLSFRLNTGYAIPIDPSVHHSFRFWAKADTPTYVVPTFRSASTGSASGTLTETMVWIDTTWRQYEVQMGRRPTGAAAAYDSVQPGFYLADTLGTVYFDDLELYNRPIGVMYRRFTNGVVFLNPDTGRVVNDSSGTTAWRARGGQVINYASVFGDTATYDYRLIKAPANSPFQPLNNGRIFGYGTAALDTIPDGQAKFVIRAANNYWNSFPADGGRVGRGRLDRLIRGRGR